MSAFTVQTEELAPYGPVALKPCDERTRLDDETIRQAIGILHARMRKSANTFAMPSQVREYCQLRLAGYEYEVFAVLFLDSHNRLIECREMFRGTVTQTSVYPREVAREALELGAMSVVLSHNHPSGSVEPSRADEALTQRLKSALMLIDVRVLDHIIVSPTDTLSMAERGLM